MIVSIMFGGDQTLLVLHMHLRLTQQSTSFLAACAVDLHASPLVAAECPVLQNL